MGKQEREALRRLEAALLTQEHTEDEVQILDHTWEKLSPTHCPVYNTDTSDVDMDAFSEAVHQGKRKRPFLSFLTAVILFLLAAALWILLQIWEVI